MEVKKKVGGVRVPNKFERECPVCGQKFFTTPGVNKLRCSPKCANMFRYGYDEKTRTCTKCEVRKDNSEFSSNGTRGLRPYCKECSVGKTVEYKSKNPEAHSRYQHHSNVRRYGIEPADYLKLLEKQNWRCAICRTDKPNSRTNRMHIDHDHSTKSVRGLLCGRCNTGLGFFKDDKQLLATAIAYLTPRHETPKLVTQETNMAVFRDSNLNIIDTLGQNQPSSAAHSPSPNYKAVPASTAAGTVAASDFQYTDSTTKAAVADRA